MPGFCPLLANSVSFSKYQFSEAHLSCRGHDKCYVHGRTYTRVGPSYSTELTHVVALTLFESYRSAG